VLLNGSLRVKLKNGFQTGRPVRSGGKMVPYFVSFYPQVPMEENLSVFQSLDVPGVQRLLTEAAGVVIPRYILPSRYETIIKLARHWFPRLRAKHVYEGKTRQVMLFRELNIRHPESLLFESSAELMRYFNSEGVPWEYPLVLKGDLGGGGSAVFPIYRHEDVSRHIGKIPSDQPMLLQRWVEHGGKDLRVVTYGQDLAVSYFRVGGGQFYNNVCRGGRMDHDGWPEQQAKGIEASQALCRRAMIDIAGFDLMFPDEGEPVFVEINFNFGRKGLGGLAGHRKYEFEAVRKWRERRLRQLSGEQ
jgi:ribosomal protein S6--L-glutamate ligase